MTTLGQLYDFPQLVVRKTAHSNYEKITPLKTQIPVVDNNALLGIEVEVENMRNLVETRNLYWTCKEDNSLRNNGVEFVSIPLRGHQLNHALEHLDMIMNEDNKPVFSTRTSVHVHLNVRDLTREQVQNLIMLYSLFEKHFFHIAGTKRETSIFCVPLYKTRPTAAISTLLMDGHLVNWHKYYALNLCTLVGTNNLPMYGTVEFRHLYGTGNKETIINWINNILLLRKAAINTKYDELLEKVKEMNTTSSYIQMYLDIFGNLAMPSKMVKYDFESCVTATKRWEWGHALRSKYTTNIKSVVFQRKQQEEKETENVVRYLNKQNYVEIFHGGKLYILDQTKYMHYEIVDSITLVHSYGQTLVSYTDTHVLYTSTIRNIALKREFSLEKYPAKLTPNHLKELKAMAYQNTKKAITAPEPIQTTLTNAKATKIDVTQYAWANPNTLNIIKTATQKLVEEPKLKQQEEVVQTQIIFDEFINKPVPKKKKATKKKVVTPINEVNLNKLEW